MLGAFFRRFILGTIVLITSLFLGAGISQDSVVVSPEASAALISKLTQKADSMHLDQNPHWLRLLHYHRARFSQQSDIDGGYFFLSKNGKWDSRAELHATIRGLLTNQNLAPPMEKGFEAAEMHPLCKFRGRLRFLQKELGFSDSLLPQVDCNRFFKWRKALNPAGVSLIFASGYLNNPASVFGHTFLRFDTYAADSSRAILNYGITYAASVPPGEGFKFMFKGVWGGYRATYGLQPYFISIQKYSNLESRDIFEYPLNLDSTQIEFLLEHVWEVGATWMNYYFFSENCSYNILTLLDAINPEWNLVSNRIGKTIIPTETVKEIRAINGLTNTPKWRPSVLSEFQHRTRLLNEPQKKCLEKLIHVRKDSAAISCEALGLSSEDKTHTFDVALDYIQYQKRKNINHPNRGWSQRQADLLRQRAAMPPLVKASKLDSNFKGIPPESGHHPERVAINLAGDNYRTALGLGYRFAYHDALSPNQGFLPGSSIEALQLKGDLRWRPNENSLSVSVRSADILKIQSITPRSRFYKPWSWGLHLGMERIWRDLDHEEYPLFFRGGPGWAFSTLPFRENSSSRAVLYGLIELQVGIAGLNYDDLRCGPILRIGEQFQWGKQWGGLVEGRVFYSALEKSRWDKRLNLALRRNITLDQEIRWESTWQNGVGRMGMEWLASF